MLVITNKSSIVTIILSIYVYSYDGFVIIFDFRYCPNCKEHRQASKKLDIWRLPEILIVHLKRFTYKRFTKDKLETFVDFPIEELNLSTYIIHNDGEVSHKYMLYAISNHYGSMGGGHYTAFVQVSIASIYNFHPQGLMCTVYTKLL